MSTRGLVGFRLDGKDYLSYNHYDSYPEGLGQNTIDHFIKKINWNDEEVVSWIKGKVKSLKLVDPDAKVPEDLQEKLSEYTDPGYGEPGTWYQVLRKTQGDLFAILSSGYMTNDKSFIYDSLFCEYAYIINLDNLTFEVYEGFQKTKPKMSRYGIDKPDGDRGYYACELKVSYFLSDIPDNWIKFQILD